MRRRKARVVWLPSTPDNAFKDPDETSITCWISAPLTISENASFDALELPLTIDEPNTPGPGTSLSDIENTGYRLRRVVGKVWCRLSQNDAVPICDVGVTAGLIVRRVDSAGISLAASADPLRLIHPSFQENVPDPWIWRRSWLLRNNLGTVQFFGNAQGPETNQIGPGSALDGPHVDQKTARLISQEERLFLDAGAIGFTTDAVNQNTLNVDIIAELRLLVSMRTSSGNRRNASR